MSVFESKLENAKSWKERTARTFLRKNSRYTLMEALSPRTEFGINVLKMKKKKPSDDNSYSAPTVFDVKLEGCMTGYIGNIFVIFNFQKLMRIFKIRNCQSSCCGGSFQAC